MKKDYQTSTVDGARGFAQMHSDVECGYAGPDEEWGTCPACGRTYDEIDSDYQRCTKCGWDPINEAWGEIREPAEDDYMNGDADMLTGEWC